MGLKDFAEEWSKETGQPSSFSEVDQETEESDYGEHSRIHHPPQTTDEGKLRETYGLHGLGKPEWRPAPWKVWLMVVLWVIGATIVGLGLVLPGWWLFGVGWAPIIIATIFGKIIHVMEYTEEYVPSIERAARGETPYNMAR